MFRQNIRNIIHNKIVSSNQNRKLILYIINKKSDKKKVPELQIDEHNTTAVYIYICLCNM